jgi:dTDP-3,4-didehydro-2,6-dideoxy-alpha-D-glucose 3-reductase
MTSTGPDGRAPLRFGVLGCADIAARRAIPGIKAGGCALAAVASREAAKAKAFADRFDCAPVHGYEGLLQRDDVDAVYLPLPNSMHEEWVVAALEAGKHVLVEKAATTSAAAARRITALAERRGLLLVENFAFLRHSQHAELRRLVGQGTVGRPQLVEAAFGIPLHDRGTIRHRPELGGGARLDTGCYPVRWAQQFLGPDAEVVGATLRVDRASGVDVSGTALLVDGEGLAAQCAFGFEHGYRSTCSVWGETGRISLPTAFTPPPTARPVLRTEKQDLVEERTLPADDQFANVMSTFAELVGKPELHAAPRDMLVRQAELLAAVREKAHTAHSRS